MKYINPLNSMIRNHLLYYPTPTSLSYFWNFGSLAGFCLIIQIISGLFLSMHYSADTALAFDSVEHIMRDVNFGWLLRYTHSNGASMFLLVIYIHMARGIFFRSYISPRERLWYTGVILFLLLMATAFLGYVLPWGQMSLWGATVITNLATAIPLVGQKVAYWLWGGYSVDNATLTRFFTFHFLIPFLMVGLTLLHLSFLHIDGSTNPLGLEDSHDFIPFYPYFLIKDIFGFLVFLLSFSYLVFFEPNFLGHPDNYIRANPLITPPHIVPEWYFLPFYAILRAVPSKLGGVVAMAAAVGILFLLPSLDKGGCSLFRVFGNVVSEMEYFLKRSNIIYHLGFPDQSSGFVLIEEVPKLVWDPKGKKGSFRRRKRDSKSTHLLFMFLVSDYVEDDIWVEWSHSEQLGYQGPRFRPLFKFLFSFWVLNFLLLGFLGGKPVEFPFNELSVLVSCLYFSFFIFYF